MIVYVLVVLQLFASVIVTVYVPAPIEDKSSVVAPLLHAYLYAGVPPLIVWLIEPFVNPLHVTLVNTLVTAIVSGCDIVSEIVAVQPLKSVTVMLYIPTHKLAISSVVWPEFQEYV